MQTGGWKPPEGKQMIEITEAPPSDWSVFAKNVYSQFGEDGIIAEIFNRIGTTNKQCFEVGAANGNWFSNSRLLIDDGWSAALIEADPANWPQLDKLDNPPKVNVIHGKVEPSGPNSLDSILAQCGFSEAMDLGVIDVDGQDYYLWNGMLKYRPRVMVVEFDPQADKTFVPGLNGKGQAGFNAIMSVAVSRGYFNVAVTHTNAIFVHNSERDKFYAATLPAKIEPDLKPSVPMLATGKEEEIKIAAVVSRPRFGLNCFFDCVQETLGPYGIPLQSFGGVYWEMAMAKSFEENYAAGIDWLLTYDYDTMASSRHLQMLIDALGQNPEIDAIAGLQCRRGRPLPLAVRADGTMPLNGKPVQVATAHFGFTLFRMSSYAKMKNRNAWLVSQPAPDGGWGEGRLDADIAAWRSWREAGNTIYVHGGVTVGHVEEMVSQYEPDGTLKHHYLTDWRKKNGQRVKVFD